MEVDCKCPNCGYQNKDLEDYIVGLEAKIKIFESEYCKLVLMGGPFIASKTRTHFHKPNCEWAEYISEKNMLVFHSHKEAEDAGFKPCKTCKA